MKSSTKQNLTVAMQSEAFAHAKYLRFAARARRDEEWELATTFQNIAESDRTEYFAKEAELSGLGSDTPRNLRTAIDDHIDQVKMYTQFNEAAVVAGDLGAAALFERLAREKTNAQANLEAALERLGYASSVHLVEA